MYDDLFEKEKEKKDDTTKKLYDKLYKEMNKNCQKRIKNPNQLK